MADQVVPASVIAVAELVAARGRELLRGRRWPGRAAPGVTAMLVSVWFTVTLTLLVAVSPPGSVIVTRKLVAPGLGECGRGVLGRIAAIGRKRHRGGRRAGGGPGVGEVALRRRRRPQAPLRAVVVPVTGLGEAVAGVTTVGGICDADRERSSNRRETCS